MSKFRSSAAFIWTIAKVLFAVAIIAIFALVVLSVGSPTHDRGRGRGESEIMAMEAGLESYKADHGDYPTGTNLIPSSKGNNAFLFRALSGSNGSGKVYVEFNKNQTNGHQCIIDPSGNLYCYQYPGATNRSGTNFPDLYSIANSTNTNAWIKNW